MEREGEEKKGRFATVVVGILFFLEGTLCLSLLSLFLVKHPHHHISLPLDLFFLPLLFLLHPSFLLSLSL